MFPFRVARIPPVLWPRLHDDLSTYIVQREANGILVFYWYHRQFIAVAKRRYLKDPAHNQYIHSLLADYFLGEQDVNGANEVSKFALLRRRQAPGRLGLPLILFACLHFVASMLIAGTWGGGKKKPFSYSEKHMKQLRLSLVHSEADRKVPLQPLKFGKGEWSKLVFPRSNTSKCKIHGLAH